MNHLMITERLHDLHPLPNFKRRSNQERSDKKAYGTQGKFKIHTMLQSANPDDLRSRTRLGVVGKTLL